MHSQYYESCSEVTEALCKPLVSSYNSKCKTLVPTRDLEMGIKGHLLRESGVPSRQETVKDASSTEHEMCIFTVKFSNSIDQP